MKTKNILLLIVGLFVIFSSTSAQYIENDTRLDEGAVKATRTMSITTTSAESELYNDVNENNNTEKYLWIVGIISILVITGGLFFKKK